MTDDMALVREYARNRSEAAFAALVSRHLNLVYSVALREIRDPHLAEEVTQAAFIILARKAGALGPKTILSGWLCRTARYVSAEVLRSQRRRQKREQEACMQSLLNEPAAEAWMQIAPLLETAMAQLGEQEHNAIVLRFYEGKALKQVGAALGTGEDAARMRINRALEKLRKFFAGRGLTLSATVIAAAVSTSAVQAAPAGLAATVTTAAVQGTAVTASTLTLIKGALKIMAWTKAKTAIVVGASVLLAAGTTTITVKEIRGHRPYSWQVRIADWRMLDRLPQQVKIVPTIFPPSDGYTGNNGRKQGTGLSLRNTLLPAAYGISRYRIVADTPLPEGNYDFIANLPDGNEAALRREIEKQFHLVGRTETRETDVLLLTTRSRNAPGLKSAAATGSRSSNINNGSGFYKCSNAPLEFLATSLEYYFELPVIDRTGIEGRFDIDLKWDERDRQHRNPEGLKQVLLDQLGLELVPGRESIDMLVVGKSQN
jgi:uncharacterized protein (TIGR03435 family)